MLLTTARAATTSQPRARIIRAVCEPEQVISEHVNAEAFCDLREKLALFTLSGMDRSAQDDSRRKLSSVGAAIITTAALVRADERRQTGSCGLMGANCWD